MFTRILRLIDLIIYLLLCVLLLTGSNTISNEPVERARAYTRPVEFDYFNWSVDAAVLKLQSSAIGLPNYLGHESRKQAVMQYLYLTERVLQGEDQLTRLYADPAITDKEAASAHLRAEMETLYQRQKQLAPLAESILQEQVGTILAEQNLTSVGQPIPPVLYRSSAVPMGLIVSPRDHIEQLTNISVQPNLSVDQQASIENQVDASLDVSTLVVPIGGVGVYPTMIMRTTSLPWLLDTIAHEWTHNFLTLRPLGFLYDATPELRTMNETTASIVGGEIGQILMQRYYPELTAASPAPLQLASVKPAPSTEEEPPPFDFRAEMHETRVTTDKLLEEGKIEEAEAYMEARREIFWQNGYAIRKLNQAYFAFYGAYADVPGGPAGEDPVGPAVRALREQSESLADFVKRIAWMTSFEELQAAIQ
ncbi:MAG: hypothetical protein JW963_26200 [Anaerolineales bacterium]|nr:hypothetical protein [Anaerolineales bacterium]